MAILPSILGFLISQLLAYWIFPNTFATYSLLLTSVSTAENWSGRGLFIAGLGLGILALPAFTYCLNYIIGSKANVISSHDVYSGSEPKAGVHGGVYGLEHGILNLEVPPKSMWMNMGYWENDNSDDFPAACRELLNQVLASSGLLRSNVPTTGIVVPKIKLIDLGFGCGDQTLYLAQLEHSVPDSRQTSAGAATSPLFNDYIGITLEQKQFALARHRNDQLNDPRIHIFCADAAKPQTWTEELRASTASKSTETTATWLLALDTLYHFSPSRFGIFQHAHETLNANIAAFDLLLTDESPTYLQRLLLNIVALGSSTPRGNFLTTAQYTDQLVSAGYAADDVAIHDISDHVFSGLAKFLERHDGRLRGMGLGGIGRFHVAKWVFGWWASTGIVRGCIVVAKRK